jgi:hypothetical protein
VTTLKRISLLLALAVSLAAAGCGSDEEGGRPIPADTAAALEAQLDKVQARLDNGSEGACKDILEAPPERGPNRDAVQQLIDGLPNDVDPDVREAAQESFDNLWSLVESKCEDLKPDEPVETETTPPETTTTETETTETTETTPPETETEPTTPGEETIPPDGDGENGGAIPPDENGNGGGVGPGSAKEKKKEKGE